MPFWWAPRSTLILALAAFPAYAQPTIIGTIDKLAENEIRIKTRTKTVTLLVEDGTVHGPSPLKTGNEVSIRCRPNGSGKLVAVRIWTTVVAFSATVKYIDRDDVEVVTGSGSHKIVHLHPDTAFSTNRKDLIAGQYVRVVGLEVENGTVDATRITVYNTDMPAVRSVLPR